MKKIFHNATVENIYFSDLYALDANYNSKKCCWFLYYVIKSKIIKKKNNLFVLYAFLVILIRLPVY